MDSIVSVGEVGVLGNRGRSVGERWRLMIGGVWGWKGSREGRAGG